MSRPARLAPVRVRARVRGVVQGVGFRPHVYRLVRSLGLAGFVRNDPLGVSLEVEGAPDAVESFLRRLRDEAPPLAVVEEVEAEPVEPLGEAGFRILESRGEGRPAALVSPDAATCDECLAELFDPSDRRHRYPFINCTHCGPRFTVVRGIPYDRPLTTMAGFAMCDACRTEYGDPADRRFHAQPLACPACGPRARLLDRDGRPPADAEGRDPVAAAARALRAGAIVAVKGLGGYHLACRADDEDAVALLRARKHREDKPFALMAPDLAAARSLAFLDDEEERLLASRERPIVLAPRRPGAAVARAVAPGHRDLGVMLAYSPLHHLLLADAGLVLVMTSGNVSDEPIAYRDGEARERLAGIVDLFLAHDRPIETRTDDSVVRVVRVGRERRPLMLRRSRGYVPAPLDLPVPGGRPSLSCGAHLKNTFAVARGGRAWVGPHVGDLENWETLRSFREGVAHLERLFEVAPEVVAHDLHPEYLSTKYAAERAASGGLIGVQHHHAHLAACLAEHGETGPALGAIYDGTGWGPDGTVWGGELLLGDLIDFERVAHLWPVRLPGGEAAVREPWRMACAWLMEAAGGSAAIGATSAPAGRGDARMGAPTGEPCGDPATPPLPAGLTGEVEPWRWEAVARLARSGLRSPVTTSVGRLFDAVAAVCGLRARITYEGQAAIELEMAASGARGPSDRRAAGAYPLPAVHPPGGPARLDARPTVRAVVADLAAGVPAGEVAARFHDALADATVRCCAREAERAGIRLVVLSGGVFQNVRLLERTASGLLERGLRVLVPERIPPNDGGVSYGQAAVAAARSASSAPPPGTPGGTGLADRMARTSSARPRRAGPEAS